MTISILPTNAEPSFQPEISVDLQNSTTNTITEVAHSLIQENKPRILSRSEGLDRLIELAKERQVEKLSQQKSSGIFQKIMNIFNAFRNLFASIGALFHRNNASTNNTDILDALSEAPTREIQVFQFQTMDDVFEHENFSTDVKNFFKSGQEPDHSQLDDLKFSTVPLDDSLFEELLLTPDRLPAVINPTETFLQALKTVVLELTETELNITSLDEVIAKMNQTTVKSYNLTSDSNDNILQKLYQTKFQVQKDFNRWNQIEVFSGDEHFSMKNLLIESRDEPNMRLLYEENPAQYKLLIANKMQLCLQDTLLKNGFNTPDLLQKVLDSLQQGLFFLADNKDLHCVAGMGSGNGRAKFNIQIESGQVSIQASHSQIMLRPQSMMVHPPAPTGDIKTEVTFEISPDRTILTETQNIYFSEYPGIFYVDEDEAFYKEETSATHHE